MKKQKRKAIFLWAVLSGVLLVSGCLSSTGKTAQNSISNGEKKPVWDFKYDPPITITTGIVDENRPNAFKPDESLTDNVHTRWMEDNLGIVTKFDWIVSKFEDADTKIRLALAVNGRRGHP